MRCDTLRNMGVTFVLELSATENGSAPLEARFEMIYKTAWFAVTLVELDGGVAKRVRLAM